MTRSITGPPPKIHEARDILVYVGLEDECAAVGVAHLLGRAYV